MDELNAILPLGQGGRVVVKDEFADEFLHLPADRFAVIVEPQGGGGQPLFAFRGQAGKELSGEFIGRHRRRFSYPSSRWSMGQFVMPRKSFGDRFPSDAVRKPIPLKHSEEFRLARRSRTFKQGSDEFTRQFDVVATDFLDFLSNAIQIEAPADVLETDPVSALASWYVFRRLRTQRSPYWQ